MAISEIKKTRLKKLEQLQKAGINPYPIKSNKSHSIKEALLDFEKFSRSKIKLILAGRITALREHGGSTFIHFEDGSSRIQAYFKKDRLGKKYRLFLDNFDVGDLIEISGILFNTKKGEKTLEVTDFKMLAKSLLPLPEKWHGLKDTEERFRKRYLDLIFNEEAKEKFEIRSKVIKEIRNFLEEEGFLEVETPVLQPIYGGARALPFKTHLNALKMDLYLRISPELYLKRLLVGGFEKVYEIGRCFRNEGMDKHHNPDFTMLEFYWAYADYEQMMRLTEGLFSHLFKKVFKSDKIKYRGEEINFKTPFKKIEFYQLLEKYTKINLEKISQNALYKKALKLGVKTEKERPKAEIADEIYKKYCRPKISEPTFVIHHPSGFQPLAKKCEKDPKRLANFQLLAGGTELINAFSELNDSLEQKERFIEQEKLHKKGLKESQRMDLDYIEALEYGMPPAAGFGMGIDRLVALLTDSHSLREVILFPTMKPKK